MRSYVPLLGKTFEHFVTFTGKTLSLLNPLPSDICIKDIAHALSLINRFGGHTPLPYSVAAHSVHVSRLVDDRFALHGLLHDAAEAYLGDVVRPLKSHLHGYELIESLCESAIEKSLGFKWYPEALHAVKRADNLALRTELEVFFPFLHSPQNPDPSGTYSSEDAAFSDLSYWRGNQSPIAAEAAFIHRYQQLSGEG